MADKEYGLIKLPKPVIYRLKSKAHPGQTYAGVIIELLDLADKVEGKPTVSKPVSDKPDEIIKNW